MVGTNPLLRRGKTPVGLEKATATVLAAQTGAEIMIWLSMGSHQLPATVSVVPVTHLDADLVISLLRLPAGEFLRAWFSLKT